MAATTTVVPGPAAKENFKLNLPHLRFPSYPLDGGFVVRVTHSADDLKSPHVLLELQSKRLKAKWQGTFSSPKAYLPQGVELPQDLVLSNLKAALEAQGQPPSYYHSTLHYVVLLNGWLHQAWHKGGQQNTSVVVDLTCEDDGSMTLEMRTKLFDTQSLRFAFRLTPVAVDSLDVLNAKLSDVQAKLIQLENAMVSKTQCVVVMALVLSVSMATLGVRTLALPPHVCAAKCKDVCLWPYVGFADRNSPSNCKVFSSLGWCPGGVEN
ncbi:hypothetical protein H257_13576 [Aphanomyces astaci]|uniref:Uncharacterized protein n=1 Tax=Aphanomyces astaci TaxID=112090 RepID=W4FWM8_APHAT|nr:hypothetical protein H257_13576 [Aphanomyces astaci]ETV71194.1 hypothetical protein H257_13576 [Aphanomyces astaci]|eukprot:XP_009839440.1 hypothetical protein H257_13576 [Aphanomyces astaci]